MKKILFIALALVASVLAFTSCDPKEKGNTPENPLYGTWRYKTPPAPDSGWYGVYTFEFKSDGTFSFLDQAFAPGAKDQYDGFITRGSYEIKDDVITLHKEKKGELRNGEEYYYDEYEPETENMKYRIENNKLYLTREYGSEIAWDETYTKVSGDEPEEFDPTDLFGTMWRADSVFVNGEKSPGPHFIVDVISLEKAILNGDTVSYRFEDKHLIIESREMDVEVTEYTGNTAKLKITGDNIEMYVSKLPAFDYDAQILEPQTADFVGTWKLAYYTMTAASLEGIWNTMGTNPGVETWELRADGTATYHSTFFDETENGTWSYEYGMIMVKNPAESHLRDENDRITVQPLTKNWMGFVRGDGNTTYQWFFVRVK